MESVVIHDSVTDDYRDAAGPLTIGGGSLPDPSGEPDGQWLRTASGAAVWVAATAADIPFVPAGTISATDVQAAIEEVATEASGGVPTSRTLTAGAALTGGGTLAADRTFDVAVDGSTIEVNADALRVKADGITANEIAAGAVGASELASTAVAAGTYGDATHVAQVTVDADGRITGASDVAISGGGGGGGIGSSELIYRYTVTGTDKASIDTGADTAQAGSNVWTNGDLLEVFMALRTDAAGANTTFDVTLNNSGASVYDVQQMYRNNNTTGGTASLAQAKWSVAVHGSGGSASYPSMAKIVIPNFAGTAFFKVGELITYQGDATAASNEIDSWGVGFRDTSAITRLKIACISTQKFKVGSQLLIYKRLAS